MNQEISPNLDRSKLLKIGLIITAIALIGLVAYFVITSLAPRTLYEAKPINFTSDTAFTELKSGVLYSYNGATFTAVDLTSDGDPRVLHPGLKLPLARQVVWAGDKGALMSFDSGFTYTEVERHLEERGVSLFDNYSDYLWYVSFRDGSLQLVAKEPLMSDQIHYSESANGFYFALNTPSGSPRNLAFYSIDSKELSYIESMPALDMVTHINDCFEAKSVCVTAREITQSAKPTIYRIDSNDQQSSAIVSSTGRITPTGHPDIYIVSESLDQSEVLSDDIDIPLGDVKLYDISTSEYMKVDIDIAPEEESVSVLVGGAGDELAFLSLSQGGDYTSTTKTLLGIYSTKTYSLIPDDKANTDILIPLHYGGPGQLLATDTQSNLYVIAPKGTIRYQFDSIDASDIEATLEACRPDGVSSFDVVPDISEVNIFIPDGDNFLSAVKKAARCISSQMPYQMQYHFNYKGVNAETGRITIS